jgi:hypothetical protein
LSKQQDLTFERLWDVLSYAPETGIFLWKSRDGGDRHTKRWNRKYAGEVAGHVSKRGYRIISIDGLNHRAPRLARLFITGEHPKAEVDHISRERANDKYDNLRPASQVQNQMNRMAQRNNKLGIKGVYWYKGKYAATISDGEKRRHLGRFSTKQEAIAAYNKAAAVLHGEFVRPSVDPDNPPLKVRITRYGQGGPLPEPRSTIAADGTVVDLEFVRYGEAVT